ncbi:ribose-5-phosphate isomerase A [Vibrio chagasii]|nr:ribose-5-phosphate isomerase A [Vibrio chagasii]
MECNDVAKLSDIYVDGADEINPTSRHDQGRRCSSNVKIVAAISDKFVCIVDGT